MPLTSISPDVFWYVFRGWLADRNCCRIRNTEKISVVATWNIIRNTTSHLTRASESSLKSLLWKVSLGCGYSSHAVEDLTILRRTFHNICTCMAVLPCGFSSGESGWPTEEKICRRICKGIGFWGGGWFSPTVCRLHHQHPSTRATGQEAPWVGYNQVEVAAVPNFL